MAKAIAKAQNTSVSTTLEQQAAVVTRLTGGQPIGLEHVTTQDLVIPRLNILQALSPQLIKSKPEYIKGAQAGQFCDTALGEVADGPLELIACAYARVYLQWAPRNTGKGLVRNWGTDASVLRKCSKDEKNRNVLPNGDYIAETATYFVINLTMGGRKQFIPLSSTQLKAAKSWMTKITNERIPTPTGAAMPPIFWRRWVASQVEQNNNEGDWFGWKFEVAGEDLPPKTIIDCDPDHGLLNEAKAFALQAVDGSLLGDLSAVAEEASSEMRNTDTEEM